jgi:putative ABC transport system substrate-binding protein
MQFGQLRRREFISMLGGAAAWPLGARAQQPAMPVIGVLNSGTPEGYMSYLSKFRQALAEAGYVEGRNVTMEYRWAKGRYELLSGLAADLIQRGTTLIFATGGIASAFAAKKASTTIPIVFANGSDPVKLGLVSSFNRPAGNATGIVFFSLELEAKRLELLHQFAPDARIIAFLVNRTNPNAVYQLNDIQHAASSMGLKVQIFTAGNSKEVAAAFEDIVQRQIKTLVVLTDPFLLSDLDQIAELTIIHGIAAISSSDRFAGKGGLVSYGPSIANAYRLAADYVARILRGAAPADLPVQQATDFELTINLKTAKALGLTVPDKLLATADEVIE